MKKFLCLIALCFFVSTLFAEQYCEYYRYNFLIDVAKSAKETTDNLIAKGYRIVSASLDYQQKCMIVVFEDGK